MKDSGEVKVRFSQKNGRIHVRKWGTNLTYPNLTIPTLALTKYLTNGHFHER